MATAQTATGQEVPLGINRANMRWLKVVVPGTWDTSTLTISPPAGWDWTLIPMAYVAYAVSNGVYTRDADAGVEAITTHDTTTGITVLTATGSVAAGSIVYLLYGPS